MTLDRDSVLSRAFGRRSGGWKSRAPLLLGCGLLAGPRARRSWAQRMRAQAARDGRACAQAHPDDHGETRPMGVVGGRRVAARVDGGRGVPGSCLLHSLLVAPFAVRAHRVIPGSSERRGGIRVTRFGGPERKRVFVCRHPRSCPESRISPLLVDVLSRLSPSSRCCWCSHRFSGSCSRLIPASSTSCSTRRWSACR